MLIFASHQTNIDYNECRVYWSMGSNLSWFIWSLVLFISVKYSVSLWVDIKINRSSVICAWNMTRNDLHDRALKCATFPNPHRLIHLIPGKHVSSILALDWNSQDKWILRQPLLFLCRFVEFPWTAVAYLTFPLGNESFQSVGQVQISLNFAQVCWTTDCSIYYRVGWCVLSNLCQFESVSEIPISTKWIG